jgi:hypothetical protein
MYAYKSNSVLLDSEATKLKDKRTINFKILFVPMRLPND